MNTGLFNKIKKAIIKTMVAEKMFSSFRQALENKCFSSEIVDDNCITVDGLEYFFDITATVIEESGSEVGTIFGNEEEVLSYGETIEYELTNLYYFVEKHDMQKIKMEGLLSDTQPKKLNEYLN